MHWIVCQFCDALTINESPGEPILSDPDISTDATHNSLILVILQNPVNEYNLHVTFSIFRFIQANGFQSFLTSIPAEEQRGVAAAGRGIGVGWQWPCTEWQRGVMDDHRHSMQASPSVSGQPGSTCSAHGGAPLSSPNPSSAPVRRQHGVAALRPRLPMHTPQDLSNYPGGHVYPQLTTPIQALLKTSKNFTIYIVNSQKISSIQLYV